uniref:Uncharacterized protein n=1 Tax=Leersia perrieri TaxID=77586 RepID=A0A0D9UYH2_9ORYZ
MTSKPESSSVGNYISGANFIEFSGVKVVTPSGNVLVDDLTLRVELGSNLLITGLQIDLIFRDFSIHILSLDNFLIQVLFLEIFEAQDDKSVVIVEHSCAGRVWPLISSTFSNSTIAVLKLELAGDGEEAGQVDSCEFCSSRSSFFLLSNGPEVQTITFGNRMGCKVKTLFQTWS